MKTIYLKKALHYRLGVTLVPNVAYQSKWDNEYSRWVVQLPTMNPIVLTKFVAKVIDTEPVMA